MRAFAQAPSAESSTRENGSKFSLGVLAAMLVGAAAFLGIGAPAASAAPEAGPGWSYKSSFGEFFSYQEEAPRTPVVVTGSGNVFAATDQGNLDFTIRIFAPTAEGGEQIKEFSACCAKNIAVDPSGEVLYVDANNTWGQSILRFVSNGDPVPTFSQDPGFEVPKGEGLAIDPVTGDLLVADPNAEAVRRYDDTGTLLATIATPSVNPSWIVVAPDGSFYVAPVAGPDITHFSGTGLLLGTISSVGALHGLAYDPDRSLVVAVVGDKLKSYSPAGVLRSESPAHSSSGSGLAAGGSGRLYELDGSNLNLYLPAIVPGVEAPQVSSLGTHSVHVSAEVDPGEEPGGEPPAGSFARFEYSSDGGQNWTPTPDQPLENAEVTTIQADLTGLDSNVDYLVRVFAGNSDVSRAFATTSFHTLLAEPETVTGPAASITETSAELTGTVNALGAQATYHFEYGLTTAYGSRVPTGGEGVAGSERTPRNVSRTIAGLQPGTTYHYRLVASNETGEAFGEDRTFTTLAAEPPARAYEQVTPVDKKGATVNADLGFHASADGTAVSYVLTSAPSDAPSSVIYSHYVSRRGSSDWLNWESLDPPLNVSRTIVETTAHAISSDFTKTMVVSNRALTPTGPNGPYDEGGANIYIEDLETKTYTFVGANENEGSFADWASTSREKQFLAGAPDFSWVTFLSPVSLLPGAPQEGLYRWSREEGLTLQSLSTGNVQLPNSGRETSSNWVSNDGTVMAYNLMGGGVYRHELNGATTPISVVRDGPEAGTLIGGKIDALSDDGRYAFFRSGPLTTEAQEGGRPAYMYRYDAQTEELETVGPAIDGETGRLLSAGNDGRTVIYNSGVEGHPAEDGTTSWRDGVRHVFTPLHPDLNGRGRAYEMFGSPNGRFLGYLNDDGTAHLYDAETQVDACVSCLPDGSEGPEATLPPGARFISNRIPAVVLDNGTMFFTTTARLLSADHNGSRDVYAYKDGALTLISPGDGPYEARFGDATPDGSSVYFTTDQGLVGQDTDKSIDVYVYRLGGGFPGQSPLPHKECAGDECQGPAPLAPPKPVAGPPNSGNQPDGAARISVTRPKTATGASASLKVKVPAAGRIRVSGAGVKRASIDAKKAGSYRVPVRLSKQSRQTLKKKHQLTVAVTVRFTPASGEPSSAQTQVTFKQPKATRKGTNR